MSKDLNMAVTAALNGEWDKAHLIVQDIGSADAAWIHAVLHKIEGDEGNSRYWYSRAKRNFEDFADPKDELRAIERHLVK
jgi:hypothetical protein